MITRRHLSHALLTGVGTVALFRPARARPRTFEVTPAHAEWRGRLTPEQYDVLRYEGTERAFASPLLHETRDGIFACAGCMCLSARAQPGAFAGNVAFGARLGLLWAPCAGSILDLILTTAALNGGSPETTALLFVYALGAGVPLALALTAGGRLPPRLKRAHPTGEVLRRAVGSWLWPTSPPSPRRRDAARFVIVQDLKRRG